MNLLKRILIVFISIVFIICLIISALHISGLLKSQNDIEKDFLKNKDLFDKINVILMEDKNISFYYEGKNAYRIKTKEIDRIMNEDDKKTYKEIIECIDTLNLHEIHKGEELEFVYRTLNTTAQKIVYSENIEQYYTSTKDITINNIVNNWYYVE